MALEAVQAQAGYASIVCQHLPGVQNPLLRGIYDHAAPCAGDGRRSERTLHPYGLVAHSGRWYVTGADPGIGEDRTFRLDRIADTRTLPGSFEPPAGFDPAQHVLSGLAKTPYRHEVTLNIQGTIEQIRARLPASAATVEELPAASGADPQTERWFRVELHAERLDWLPPLLASLDRPFAVERPDELRELIAALASRLATRRADPGRLLHLDLRVLGLDHRQPGHGESVLPQHLGPRRARHHPQLRRQAGRREDAATAGRDVRDLVGA